jgi:predicted ATP-dependent Lon-type protease
MSYPFHTSMRVYRLYDEKSTPGVLDVETKSLKPFPGEHYVTEAEAREVASKRAAEGAVEIIKKVSAFVEMEDGGMSLEEYLIHLYCLYANPSDLGYELFGRKKS